MPRAGHKEGCQCAICKRMDAQGTPEPEVEQAVPAGRTVGSLVAGDQFTYKGQDYTRYGETEEMVVAEGADGETIRIPKDALV